MQFGLFFFFAFIFVCILYKDVELVYLNALEYNPPNIPRSRDIRSRASEFWDEACLRMEEELQPVDLNELCEEVCISQLLLLLSVLHSTLHYNHLLIIKNLK